MTGVRYGLLDLDWLLASLRLFSGLTSEGAVLAVDGEKGLTAVEGFFLARLYMYRQVYLHKAVRAADSVMRALFRRLHHVGTPPGTSDALAKAIAGLLDQPEARQALGLRARARIEAAYAWPRVAERTAAEYRQVIAEHARRR
jgi:HD superfamily phosphohydrolase